MRLLHALPRSSLQCLSAVALLGCGSPATGTPQAGQALKASVIRRFPHDPAAFTQGLLFFDGQLYESTGKWRQSTVRRVALDTGEVLQRVSLPAQFFGEGLARVDQRLLQLTWQSGVLLIWDLEFMRQGEKRYMGEGWGLCFNGQQLVMSDGSSVLQLRDPQSFDKVGTVAVERDGQPVDQLNELECVGDQVYANVWGTDNIARIDLASGRVSAWIDASGLLTPEERSMVDPRDGVLNGIAHLPDSQRFVLTGKLWPSAFEVTFEP